MMRRLTLAGLLLALLSAPAFAQITTNPNTGAIEYGTVSAGIGPYQPLFSLSGGPYTNGEGICFNSATGYWQDGGCSGSSSITWAGDLAGSSNSSQTVVGIDGHSITGISGLLKLTAGVPSAAVSNTDYLAAAAINLASTSVGGITIDGDIYSVPMSTGSSDAVATLQKLDGGSYAHYISSLNSSGAVQGRIVTPPVFP